MPATSAASAPSTAIATGSGTDPSAAAEAGSVAWVPAGDGGSGSVGPGSSGVGLSSTLAREDRGDDAVAFDGFGVGAAEAAAVGEGASVLGAAVVAADVGDLVAVGDGLLLGLLVGVLVGLFDGVFVGEGEDEPPYAGGATPGGPWD